MELNTISGLAIAGVISSVVLSMGVPIALFIAGRVKLKARISSFFIGAGTYLLFAMLLIGGLSGISNLVSMLMINSGAMQNTLAALPAESANQTVSQLSALWTTPAPLFFVSGIERISAIILHIGLSLLIYRAVKAGKCRTAAFTAVLAYGIHFIVDFFAVAGPALLPIYVIEIGVFVMAAGTLVMALKMGRMEEL